MGYKGKGPIGKHQEDIREPINPIHKLPKINLDLGMTSIINLYKNKIIIKTPNGKEM